MFLLLSLLYLVLFTPLEASSTETDCVWLPEKLSGRCWGLTEASEFAPDLDKATSADACEQLCCELGDKCVTYQWVTGHKKCYLGMEVRLGKERGQTPIWCDNTAPHKWAGHVVERGAEQCQPGQSLPFQCWDFGDERVGPKGGRLGARECGAACCEVRGIALHCIARLLTSFPPHRLSPPH